MSIFRGKPRPVRPEPAPDILVLILMLAILFSVWRLQQIVPGLASLRLPLLTLAAGIVVFPMVRPIRRIAGALKGPLVPMIAMLLLAIIGGPFAIVRGRALTFVLWDFIPTLLLALFVVASIRTPRDTRAYLGTLVCGALAYVAYMMTHMYVGSSGKPEGLIYYDANDVSLLAVSCLPIALGLAHTTTRFLWRAVWLSSAGAMLYTAVLTNSRGGFIALSVLVLYLLLFLRSIPTSRRIAAVAAMACGALVFGSSQYWSTMQTILEPEKDYNWSGNSESGRMEVWKRGIGYVGDYPLLGAGVRNYPQAEGASAWARSRAMRGIGVKWTVAHNAYVEVAVEMGIPGFLAFATFLARVLHGLYSRSRATQAEASEGAILASYMLSSMVALMVGSIFLSSQYWTYLYVLGGLSWAVSRSASSSIPTRVRAVNSFASRSYAHRQTLHRGRQVAQA